jgi:hypothetical protein
MELTMGRPPIGKTAMTATERVHRFRAKQRETKHETKRPETKSETKPSAREKALEARIRELEAELARERQKRAPVARAAATTDDGPLKARIAELERERNDAVNRYWQMRAHLELRTEGALTRKEFNKLRNVFHPDKGHLLSEAERKRHAECYEIVGRFEKLLKEEPKPKPAGRPLPTTREELMEARLNVLKENRERGLKAAATRARKKPGRQLRGAQ